MVNDSLEGRIAVVTGGGGGIGSAICRRLAEAGMRVVLTYSRSREQAEAVAASLPGAHLAVLRCLIDDIFRVNVRGAIATVRALRGLLAAEDGGLVVNISSIAARTAVGSNIAYCASKAALDNLTMSLARALAPQIRVISISPGWVDGEYARHMPPEYVQQQADLTPLGRIAQPHDVADAVYAAAVNLRFTTGCIIPVDGGRPLT